MPAVSIGCIISGISPAIKHTSNACRARAGAQQWRAALLAAAAPRLHATLWLPGTACRLTFQAVAIFGIDRHHPPRVARCAIPPSRLVLSRVQHRDAYGAFAVSRARGTPRAYLNATPLVLVGRLPCRHSSASSTPPLLWFLDSPHPPLPGLHTYTHTPFGLLAHLLHTHYHTLSGLGWVTALRLPAIAHGHGFTTRFTCLTGEPHPIADEQGMFVPYDTIFALLYVFGQGAFQNLLCADVRLKLLALPQCTLSSWPGVAGQ